MQGLDEKRAFIAKLAELLRHANVEIKDLELNGDGTFVDIIFVCGYRKRVCIEADSRAAIILDVCRGAMY